MLLEGWECSCIFLVHAVMCNRVIERCSRFADVRERKLVEGCLFLFHDPLSLQACGCNTVCRAKRRSVKMRVCGAAFAIFSMHLKVGLWKSERDTVDGWT